MGSNCFGDSTVLRPPTNDRPWSARDCQPATVCGSQLRRGESPLTFWIVRRLPTGVAESSHACA